MLTPAGRELALWAADNLAGFLVPTFLALFGSDGVMARMRAHTHPLRDRCGPVRIAGVLLILVTLVLGGLLWNLRRTYGDLTPSPYLCNLNLPLDQPSAGACGSTADMVQPRHAGDRPGWGESAR
jgi:hypothetical protein